MSETRHIPLDEASMTFRMKLDAVGSILADTVVHRVTDLEADLHIESTADPATIRRAIVTAERMCLVHDVLVRPMEVRQTVTLNGQPVP